MSKIHVTPALFETKYQIAPAEIVFHRQMSDACVRLILALNQIKHSAPNWIVIQEDLQHRLSFGRDKMKKTMMEAVKFGYLRIKQVRQEKGKVNSNGKPIAGQFFRNDFEFNIEGNFDPLPEMLPNVDENPPTPGELSLQASEPLTEKPLTAKPSTERSVLPMPDKPMPRLKGYEKAMPSYKKGSKAMEASPSKQDPEVRGRKFKRPEEQEMRFQWLLGLDLLDEKGQVNEDSLSYLAHKYTQEKLERTYFHLIYKLEQKNVPIKKSPLAFYRYLLENEHNCRASHAELNEAMARKFASELGWGTLEFKEKYVIDRNNPSKDIDFNLDPATFKDLLSGLYMSLNSNYGT